MDTKANRHVGRTVALACAVVVLSVALMRPTVVTALNPQDPPLTSFYATSWLWVDGSVEDIADVQPVASGVQVRLIRLSRQSMGCPVPIVRAVERIVPGATVADVAGAAICGTADDRIRHAIVDARDPSVLERPQGRTRIVATCGTARKIIAIDEPPNIHALTLQRSAADVYAIWKTPTRLRDLIAGQELADPFARDDFRAQEALGATVVPELRSGRFDAAFDSDHLTEFLRGYLQPANRQASPPAPELLDRQQLNLVTYVPPLWAPIALQANLTGDVRLRLTVTTASGEVTDVAVLSGQPLLTDAAVAAAKQWRFATTVVPQPPVDVTVRFDLKCGKS